MKAAATKKYRKLVKESIDSLLLNTIPWKGVNVSSVFYYNTKRRRDSDNAMGMIKSAYDGIVDAGVVLDDTPSEMTRNEPVFEIDKKFPRVKLTLKQIV